MDTLSIGYTLSKISNCYENFETAPESRKAFHAETIRRLLPAAFAALAELQAQFGDVNSGTQSQTTENEIVIAPTRDGFYRVRFPQKPNETAIKGFHGIVTATGLKMKWDSSGNGDVYWTIPPGDAVRADKPCIDEAVDMIRYWYGEANPSQPTRNRNGGKVVAVRVAETEEMS